MKKNEMKTNVMRILDQKQVPYESHYYYDTDAVAGMEVAEVLSEDPDHVFKTLVTVGASRNHFVFLVPVNRNLNLKKAAKAVNEKNVEMIRSKDLLPLTGYIHGGCSPIGMKKPFRTVIDQTADSIEKIMFSGGKIGCQVEVAMADLKKALDFSLCDITD